MKIAPDSTVYFVVPDGIDDDEHISGGNLYDRRLRDELRRRGWAVQMVLVAPGRPRAAAAALSFLADGSLVLIDGLVAIAQPDGLEEHSRRLRIVVLAHMVASSMRHPRDPEAIASERRALRAARRVLTTSNWTRSELIAEDLAPIDRIVVARPGTDTSVPVSPGSDGGKRLLCVGTVAPHKGQDVLVDALAKLSADDGWACTIVGALTAAPDYVATLLTRIVQAGLADRIALTGVLTGPRLADAYRTADLLIAPSRSESYGMAVAGALARGIPVVASRVGGIEEAIAGNPAAVLVPPNDPWTLRVILRHWWDDPNWRAAMKAAAMRSRTVTRHWGDAATIVAATLTDVARTESARPITELVGYRFGATR